LKNQGAYKIYSQVEEGVFGGGGGGEARGIKIPLSQATQALTHTTIFSCYKHTIKSVVPYTSINIVLSACIL